VLIIDIELLHKSFEYRDGYLYWKVKNSPVINIGDQAGWKTHEYMRNTINGKMIYQHRIIFAMHHGYFPDCIDHIDGDKSNNKIENLRASTKSQNGMNRKAPVNNTSGTKNIYKDRRKNRWFVKVVENGIQHHGGYFYDFSEAQIAAEKLRSKVHSGFSLC
jgi:hypothetical protein